VKIKTIGIVLSIIGAVGAIFTILLIKLFPPCCSLGMALYHDTLILLTPVFMAILVVGMILYFKPEKKVKIVKTRLTKILTVDEKKVIAALRKGEKTQAQLTRELGFSKAKLSMLLEKMQKRGLLKKVKRGRTNIVVLKKF